MLERQQSLAMETIKCADSVSDGLKSMESSKESSNVLDSLSESVTPAEKMQSKLKNAIFEELSDGSVALVMKPGHRLKLSLKELLEGGDEYRDEREKRRNCKRN